MYELIQTEMKTHNIDREVSSTEFGARILSRWTEREDWELYCANEEVSSSLFGEVMWTYFYDRGCTLYPGEEWLSTYTDYSMYTREERVYFVSCPRIIPARLSRNRMTARMNDGRRNFGACTTSVSIKR